MSPSGQERPSGATYSYVRYAQENGLYSDWLLRSGPSQKATTLQLGTERNIAPVYAVAVTMN